MAAGHAVDAGQPVPRLNDRVRNLMEGLGQSSSEVANSLRRTGVTGVRGFTRGCAVARFLSAVVGAEQAVGTIRVYRRLVFVGSHRGFGWSVVKLPGPVRQFVKRFDAGEYPELEVGSLPATSGRVVHPPTPVADESKQQRTA